MRNILVTGGCGFIGSNFIRYMTNNYLDYRIINLDKLTYAGNEENLKDIESNHRYYFHHGDICNESLVNYLIKTKNVDTIVNFAAETHVDKSNLSESTEILRRTNVIGTSVLLEKAKENNIKKFLQISTDEVYGSIREGSFNETSNLNPSNPYSRSKAKAEEIVLAYSKYLPVLITRSSNNFGPYQYPEKFMSLMITNVLEGHNVPVYGDGKQVRDWLYVEDNCDAIDFILHNGEAGEIYNITTKNERENIWITKKILRLLEKKDIEIENLIQHVKDRPDHDTRYSIDNTKLLKLGWNIKSDFEKNLEKTVRWYRGNRSWWERIRKKPEFKKWYNNFYIKERGLK
jgi:dTDP-glucose 4,6-dehydratase